MKKGITERDLCYIKVFPCEDTFVRNGEYHDKALWESEKFQCKSEDTPNFFRKILMKFDLSHVADLSFIEASLFLCATENNRQAKFGLYDLDPESFCEETVTFDHCPAPGKRITGFVAPTGAYQIDLTDYLRDCISQGKTYIGFMMLGEKEDPEAQVFCSSKCSDKNRRMRLEFRYEGETYHRTLPHDEAFGMADPYENAKQLLKEYLEHYELWRRRDDEAPVLPIKEDKEEYCTNVRAKRHVGDPAYLNWPSRSIDTIKDYTATVDPIDHFGGDLTRTYEATGFFYTKEIDGRWMLINPDGHPYFNAGVCTLVPGCSEKEKECIIKRYGSNENWGKEISKRFKELRIGSTGGSSSIDYINTSDDPINMMMTLGFASSYGREHGLVRPAAGCWFFVNNDSLPVFDPAFVPYADGYAARHAEKWRDNPYFLGYMSDNEIAVEVGMLTNYLTVDYEKPENAYSYAFAWTWLSFMTGKKNPTLRDVTPELSELFRGAVYDRYFYVVRNAIKRHDPNHFYMGCRFKSPGYFCEQIMRAEGYYCDVCTHNFYFYWTPDSELMANWATWNKKPFIVTEFYAKGMDTGFPNKMGAGWICPTQTERTQFFENYVLKLLESSNCVGYHWFRYIDCDVEAKNVNISDIDSNKGIVRADSTEYEQLVGAMQRVGENTYTLIDFFNRRKKNQ